MRSVLSLALAGLLLASAYGQRVQVQAQSKGKSVSVEASRFQGKVKTVQSSSLTRFSASVVKPTIAKPAARPGFVWKWHVRYGWVCLPVATAPRVEILEETFVLPETVIFYESAAPITVICPHCNKEIHVIGK